MAELRDVMLYICQTYPYPHELSKARLTKMIYLADWRSALDRGVPLTGIQWEFSHYGPYVHDVANVAREDPSFVVVRTTTAYGDAKEQIGASPSAEPPHIEADERRVIDQVIETTKKLYWDGFMKLVYSTYPVVTQERYSTFDLVALAREYRAQKQRPRYTALVASIRVCSGCGRSACS